jgi:hypothetical protein
MLDALTSLAPGLELLADDTLYPYVPHAFQS